VYIYAPVTPCIYTYGGFTHSHYCGFKHSFHNHLISHTFIFHSTYLGFPREVCIYAPVTPCIQNYGGNDYNVGGGSCQPSNNGARVHASLLFTAAMATVATIVMHLL
jgi:hypothetical protein